MIKSINRRRNINRRITAAKDRAEVSHIKACETFDLRTSLAAVGIKPLSRRKKYPWERSFRCTDPHMFVASDSHSVEIDKPCKPLRKPITAGV